MSLSAKLRLGAGLLLWAPLTAAQSNLGELLDAGAKRLSAQEFREEVVQRMIVGPTATGGKLEVMYANSGVIQGVGTFAGGSLFAPISGEWKINDEGRICTSMRIGAGSLYPGSTMGGVILPPRCQLWFKYKEQYFFADSDSDRSARVLPRTLKQ